MTSSKNILGLFPGQGSQKIGMGKDLYESSEIAKFYFQKADKALGFSLSQICFEGPAEKLTSTEIAQPAILTVSTICYEIAKEKSNSALTPNIAAGHSLGEYSALVAASALSFDDAVVLVNKRGRYMQEAVPAGEGSMLAILGKEVEEIETAITQVTQGVAEIANINAPGQIVVAGDMQGLANLREVMSGTKIIELTVSAPFHCRLMKNAAENLKKDLAAININSCAFPVISNYSAKANSEPQEIRKNLELQVCGRVRWVESIQLALQNYSPLCAVEFGSGNVLSGLLKRISSDTPRFSADTQESIEKALGGVSIA